MITFASQQVSGVMPGLSFMQKLVCTTASEPLNLQLQVRGSLDIVFEIRITIYFTKRYDNLPGRGRNETRNAGTTQCQLVIVGDCKHVIYDPLELD